MAGRRLRLALEAVTARPGVDDDRDPGQRAADGLDTIARAVLADAGTRPGGHVPAQITMILSAEQWAAAKAARSRRRDRAVGACPAGVAGADTGNAPSTEAGPATLEDGTPVPGSELAQALCEAAVTRLVIDAESKPLDVGRAERVFTGPRRRAVVARDRHCAWPGCRMNARWCEVHHLDWWDRDEGRTDVARGVLLCSFHHHEIHRRDLQLHDAGPAPDGDVAMVAYRVTDRTGRVVHPAGTTHGTGARRRIGDDEAALPPDGGPPGCAGPPRDAGRVKGGRSPDATGPPGSGSVPDQGELDLVDGTGGDREHAVDPGSGERGARSKVA